MNNNYYEKLDSCVFVTSGAAKLSDSKSTTMVTCAYVEANVMVHSAENVHQYISFKLRYPYATTLVRPSPTSQHHVIRSFLSNSDYSCDQSTGLGPDQFEPSPWPALPSSALQYRTGTCPKSLSCGSSLPSCPGPGPPISSAIWVK